MIYVTGDTHGIITRFNEENLGDSEWTENDYLIICGDFGFVFFNDKNEERMLNILSKKPYKILFCDGNHENFNTLNSLPVEIWHGGKIHRIRDNIYHLMRGQVFEIEGKKIFVMGGAYSIDRVSRLLNYSYWEEELPDRDELEEGRQNIEKHNGNIDIIISHTASYEVVRMMGFAPCFFEVELSVFLNWINSSTNFSHWYFGHFHIDRNFSSKITAVYQNVYRIE